MSKVLVLAPTGSGKSSSLRNLPPEFTGIINCDRKELPLAGASKKYVTVYTSDGKVDIRQSNYLESDKASAVLKTLEEWEKIPKIRNIVIDTITHLITREYMYNTIGRDFKAYQALGKTFYDIIEKVRSSNKNVIVYGHVEKRITDAGDVVWDMKSHGKMITDLVPASYFTTVLIGEKKKQEDGTFGYFFRTQSEGNDPAKSPAHFNDKDEAITALQLLEKNDINVVLEKLELFGKSDD